MQDRRGARDNQVEGRPSDAQAEMGRRGGGAESERDKKTDARAGTGESDLGRRAPGARSQRALEHEM